MNPVGSMPVPPPKYGQKSGNLDTLNPCLTPSSSWGMDPGGRHPSHLSGEDQIAPTSGLGNRQASHLLENLVVLPQSCEGPSKCNEATRLGLQWEGMPFSAMEACLPGDWLTPRITEMGVNWPALPHPTIWLRRGPGCRRPSNQWTVGPNSPHRLAPTCRAGPQSPVSLAFPPTLRWESLRVQWGRRQEQPPVRVGEVPAVQWRPWTRVANPGNPGKGAKVACSIDKWRSSSGRSHLWGVRPTPTVLLLDQVILPVR